MSQQISHCPICGNGPFLVPYQSIAEIRESFDICSCCGCEYGYDDNLQHYMNWVSNGCKWFTPEEQPQGWSLDSQVGFQIRPWPPSEG